MQCDRITSCGTFTTSDSVTTGWSQPLIFTDPSQIAGIRVAFSSQDPDWLDPKGPLGGEPRCHDHRLVIPS